MYETMSIRRSSEEGKYLLREGDCLWRVNEDGMVDCTSQGHSEVFELLTYIQQLKTPSLRLLQENPLQDELI